MKRLFSERKISRKSIIEFLDKKGFYIVLVLCIAVVGATAVFVASRNLAPSNHDYNADKIIPDDLDSELLTDADIKPSEESSIDIAAVLPEEKKPEDNASSTTTIKTAVQDTAEKKIETGKTQKVAAKQSNTQATNKTESTIKASVQEKDQQFIMPVVGRITFDYAQDRLVYSKTLEEWRTHSGIDLAADRGTPVKAVADGVVSEIKNDPRYGATVIIDHANGLRTVYANLAGTDMVQPNQKVKQGDIIGCVGNTALFESAEQSHLHFEVLKGNEPVDPQPYLPIGREDIA